VIANIRARLDQLRKEYAAGMDALAEIQKKQEELRSTVLRICGAIQVLEELLAECEAPAPAPPALSEPG
jgi:hypothetical protein